MPTEVTCPECSKRLDVPDTTARTADCPHCGAQVLLSAVGAEVAEQQLLEPELVDDDVSDEVISAAGAEGEDAAGHAPMRDESAPLDDTNDRRPCPMCGETIAAAAAKCRFCGEVFDEKLKKVGTVDARTIAEFRKNIHGLGGVWVFLGIITVVFVVGFLASPEMLQGRFEVDAMFVLVAVTLLVAAILLICGVGCFAKQLWAVYVGLTVSALLLLGNVIRLNLCGILILLVVVIQGQRTLTLAGRLRRAGVPLNARPGRTTRK